MAGCPAMAQTVYLARHNAITSAVHWNLCGTRGFEQSEDWWKHNPEPVPIIKYCMILIYSLIG